jgi:hypothetical protein
MIKGVDLTLQFISVCDQSLKISSTLEGITMEVAELDGKKSFVVYLNKEDIVMLSDALNDASHHQTFIQEKDKPK